MIETSAPDPSDITAHAVRALTLYSLAEFQSGHASAIDVSADGTTFRVADDGRGHAIDRTVAGAPYLRYVYTQLDYPFAATEGGPVQLQGIGMSLLNALCNGLTVDVRKANATLRMTFRGGRLCEEGRLDVPTGSTGTAVSGVINPALQPCRTNVEGIEQWLLDVLASNPRLKLRFNGKQLHAPQPGAA